MAINRIRDILREESFVCCNYVGEWACGYCAGIRYLISMPDQSLTRIAESPLPRPGCTGYAMGWRSALEFLHDMMEELKDE